MGFVRQYTEQEVAAILKASENSQTTGESGRARGHSEGLHELVAVGARRQHTSEQGLSERVIDERKKAVGAFDGCQTKAVTFALNTKAGQTALQFLNTSSALHVFAEINVSNQNLKMKHIQADVPKVGPINKPVLQNSTVAYVAMKLMKDGGSLHIRTAFPMSAPPACGHSHCQVSYEGQFSMDQDLPA